ncbi:UNVERIFIED_CONTAM: hypothetical protein HDU68_007982 [Siphonaria sp. JEL0065]|nr:hypothetical protein HDU68_007982 [Siphonaria sp. JEL0065]
MAFLILALATMASAAFFHDMALISSGQQSVSGGGNSVGKQTLNKAGKAAATISGAVYPKVSQDTTFGLSETNAISWSNTQSANTASIVSMTLWLGTGTGNIVTDLYSVASVAYPNTTCYTWIPASDLSPSQTYTLTFKGSDAAGNIVSVDYVTWFKVATSASASYPQATACPGDSTSVITAIPASTTSSIRTSTTTTLPKTSSSSTTTTTTTNKATTQATQAVSITMSFANEEAYYEWLIKQGGAIGLKMSMGIASIAVALLF